jgi:sortase A
VVAPGDGAVLDPTTTSELTLTTCTPRFSAARRLVVVARLESSPALAVGRAPVIRSVVTGVTAPTPDPLTRASDWGWLVAWGLVAVALVVVTAVARRRLGGRWRWLAPLLAAPVGVVTLLYLFAALTVMVPASV